MRANHRSFIEGLGNGNQQTPSINIEKEFDALVEEHKRLIREERSLLDMDKIYLLSKGTEFTGEEDIKRKVKKKKSEFVRKTLYGKPRTRRETYDIYEKSKTKRKLKLPNAYDKLLESTEAKWKWYYGAAIRSYVEDALEKYAKTKENQANGKDTKLDEQDKEKVNFIERLLNIEEQICQAYGKIVGIQYAACKMGEPTDEKQKGKERITKQMKFAADIANKYKYLAEQPRLQIGELTEEEKDSARAEREEKAIASMWNNLLRKSFKDSYLRYSGCLVGIEETALSNIIKTRLENSEFDGSAQETYEELKEIFGNYPIDRYSIARIPDEKEFRA